MTTKSSPSGAEQKPKPSANKQSRPAAPRVSAVRIENATLILAELRTILEEEQSAPTAPSPAKEEAPVSETPTG